MAETYILSYLPLFYNDLEEKVAYITDVLLNSDAANNLLDAVEKAIMDRLPFAESINYDFLLLLRNENHPEVFLVTRYQTSQNSLLYRSITQTVHFLF